MIGRSTQLEKALLIILLMLALAGTADANSVWIESGPQGWYNNSNANFTFNSSDAGDIYFVTFGSYSNFQTDKFYNATGLTEKNYTLSVKAYNGTAWVGPAAGRVWIDLTPPTINITKGPGAWLNSSSAYFEWMGYDSRSGVVGYYYQLDSRPWVYTGGTNVTLTGITNGSHTFSAIAVDKAGSQSTPATYNFGINTDLPVVTITSSPSSWSNINTPTFTYIGTAYNSTILGYYYRWDSVPQNTTASTSITLPPLSDGAHTFYIQAVDALLRVGNTISSNFSIDTTKPNVTLTSGPSGWIKTSAFSFTWNGSDNKSGIAGYYYWLNNGSQIYTTSTNITLSAADGSYVFHLKPIDIAGNVGNEVNSSFGIDVGAPTVNIIFGPSGWINRNYAEFDWAASSVSNISGYYFSLDNGSKIFTTNTSIILNSIPDGSHIFSIQAYNILNTSSNTATRSFSVDTIPPTAPAVTENRSGGSSTSWPPWNSNNGPYFTWPASIDTGSGVASYEVQINNRSTAAVTSPYQPVLDTGQYIFQFWAVDNVGNPSSKTTIYLRIDTTPPVAWFVNASQYFNTTTVSFVWNGIDNESGLAGYYYNVDNGSWTYTTISGAAISVQQGIHTIYLKPIDNVGNIGTVVNSTFMVDLVPPIVNLTSGQSGWMNSGTQTFTWIGSDNLSGVKGYYYKIDNNGTWIYTAITSATVYMVDGSHTFYVKAADNAGNIGLYDSLSFNIKTTPPPAPVVSETHSNGSTIPNPPWSSHDSPYFTWDTSNDTSLQISFYQVSIDGNPWENVTTPYHPMVVAGSHIFDFRAVDIVGLASSVTRIYVRIDTIPPSVFITSGPAGWTNSIAPNFAWNGTDNLSGIAGYYYSVDNGLKTYITNTNVTLSFLSDGPHIFSVRAVDNVGLLSSNTTSNFSIDTIPPSVPIVNETHSNGSTNPNPPWSTHNTPYFDWTDSIDNESGINHYEARLNNGSWITVTKPWHPIFAAGSYAVDFRAVDNVSNAGNFTTIYVRIDNVPPVINNLSVPGGWANTSNITITWNATDAQSGVAGYYYSLDNNSENFTTNASVTVPVPDGIHSFSLRAIDNVGLSSPAMNGTLKIDTVPPNVTILSGPSGWVNTSNLVFSWNGSNAMSGIAGYYYWIDNSTQNYTTSTSAAYSSLSTGNHTFYVKAVDNAGNIGSLDSRAFRVDNIPPYLNITDAPGAWTNSTTPYFGWTAWDNDSGIAGYYYSVDGVNSTFTAAMNVTLYPLSEGAHTFKLTAMDNVGLNTTIQKAFSIDITPPTVNITSSPPAMTNNKTPSFNWSGADTGSGLRGYYYSYDNSSEIFTLATNVTLPVLSDGNHTFRVRALDMVWLFSPYDSRNFLLNTIPPSVPIVNETHSNGSTNPNPPWSTHNTPYFTWANSTGYLGSAIYYEVSINNGSWLTVSSPHHPTMPTGDYAFRFHTVDSFGNPSDPYTVYVRIDTTPPSVNITSGPMGWTNLTIVSFGWNGTDIGSGVAGYYYNMDSGLETYTTLTNASASSLSDGMHIFNVRTIDNVGLSSAAASRVFYIDNNPPNVSLVQYPKIYSNNSSPYFAWNSSDGAGSGVVGYRYGIDAPSNVLSTNTNVTLTSLPDGNHTFNIVAIDAVGWVSSVLSYPFTIATVGPGLFTINESHSNGSSLPNPPWSSHNTPYFTWSAPSSAIPIDHYEASADNNTWQIVTSPWHPSMPTRSYAFQFRAVDAAGNPGRIYMVYVRIDIDPPTINSVTGPSGWISTSPSALNPYNGSITWNATDNGSGVAGYYYNFDGGANTYTVAPNLTLPNLTDGAHTFNVKAVDNVGWNSNYSSISFSIDTVPPTVPVVSELMANGSSLPNPPWSTNGTTYFIWNPASDASSGVAYYQMRINNGTWQTVSSPYTKNMPTGNYSFDFRAVDNASNPGDYYRLYVRIDLDDPTINIPHASAYTTTGNVIYITNPADVGSGVKDVYMQIQDQSGTIVFGGWIGALGQYTFSGMAPGVNYYARAYAVDNAGRTSPWSAWSKASMYDTTDPTVFQPNVTTPTYGGGNGFTFVNGTQPSITFSFNATDPDCCVDYINYEIRTASVPNLFSGPNKTLAYSGRVNGANGTFTILSPQSATGYIARAEAFDRAGRRSGWSNNTTVIYDDVFPNLTILNSSKYIIGNTAIINGYISDDVPLAGNPYLYAQVNNNGTITYVPAIKGSNNTFTVQINNITTSTTAKLTAIDFAGNKVEKTLAFYKDNTPPIVAVTDPPNGYWTGAHNYIIRGTVYDDYEVEYVSVNDAPASLSGTNWFHPAILNWSISVELFEGLNTFYIRAKDPAGNFANMTLTIYADYSAPVLDILNPEDGAVIPQASTIIGGVAWDNTGVNAVYVNGNRASGIFGLQAVDWYYIASLQPGINTFTVTAKDDMNNNVSKNITIIRQSSVPSIAITNLGSGDHIGTEYVDINGSAYSPDGVTKITIDLKSMVPGGTAAPYASFVLYPSNTTCTPTNSSIIGSFLGWIFPPSGSTCITANSTSNWAGTIIWSQKAKLVPGMYIIEAKVYAVGGLTATTNLYIIYDDVPVIKIANPSRRVTRTSDIGILVSGTAQTNKTNITNMSLRVYNSDGVSINNADLTVINNTFMYWSFPIVLYRYGTFAVELRAYTDKGDYSKKEFIIHRIPANFTGEYFYPATQGQYPKINFTNNNTVDYYNFVKMSPDNGATMNHLIHYYLDWGEGWWKIKHNQTLSVGVKDNSGEVAGLPNYTWPEKKMLDYNLTWVAHVRWDYQEKPPQDIGENMIGWFKDRPPPGYPPYVNIDIQADPTDMNLSWYAGNLTQHGWVRVNPKIWDWNRYYGRPFTYPLKLDWTLDGIPMPPQVYMGQRASHDEGDDIEPPQGIFWLPATGTHTIGLTVTDSGLSGEDDVPGTIAYHPQQASTSQAVSVYNDPPVVNGMSAVDMNNLSNSYSANALQYLSLAGETPSPTPLGQALVPWAGQHNPVHIGDRVNITLNASDPNIEDMEYKDYLHYRYLWGDGYDSGWLNSTPTQNTFVTSTELVWNKTTLIPKINPQANNKTHRYAAWMGTSQFILNQSVNFAAQVRDSYNAVTTYNDSVFVYDNAPRPPIILSMNTTRRKAGMPPNAFIERFPIIFRAITYDPDNPNNDPGGDQVFYLYDWGDGTGSTWSTSGNASKTYIPTHWDYVDANGRPYNIYNVRIIVKDNWGLMNSNTTQIIVYKNEPPRVTINSVNFNGINLVGASPRYFCGYDCQSASRFWYSISPSTIYATIEDPDGDYFDATYDWGMNGVVTGTNQYTFGYAVFRPYDSNPPDWIQQYNFGWNLAWNQYTPGTYAVTVTATDEWGATTAVSTVVKAYPPINAVGTGIFMPDFSDYSRYDTGGFYTEQYSCSISCYYLTGYAIDHYGAAVSATVSGPFGSGSDTYYAVQVTDNLGGTHSGVVRGTDGNAIRGYLASVLGVPVS